MVTNCEWLHWLRARWSARRRDDDRFGFMVRRKLMLWDENEMRRKQKWKRLKLKLRKSCNGEMWFREWWMRSKLIEIKFNYLCECWCVYVMATSSDEWTECSIKYKTNFDDDDTPSVAIDEKFSLFLSTFHFFFRRCAEETSRATNYASNKFYRNRVESIKSNWEMYSISLRPTI